MPVGPFALTPCQNNARCVSVTASILIDALAALGALVGHAGDEEPVIIRSSLCTRLQRRPGYLGAERCCLLSMDKIIDLVAWVPPDQQGNVAKREPQLRMAGIARQTRGPHRLRSFGPSPTRYGILCQWFHGRAQRALAVTLHKFFHQLRLSRWHNALFHRVLSEYLEIPQIQL